jgi:hypothetical protein
MSKPTPEGGFVLPALPPALKNLYAEPGAHRKWIKAAWFGSWKAGKSKALSSYPSPKLVADCGDGGILPYCNKERGDVPIMVNSFVAFQDLIKFAKKNEGVFKSLIADDYTELWAVWMQEWATANGLGNSDEILAHHWRAIKDPWKKAIRDLNHLKMHVGISARLKDILYKKSDAPPGEEGGLVIKTINTPEVEKNVPYMFDLMFLVEKDLNDKMEPTGKHRVSFWAGRVPDSMIGKLKIGRTWKFDSEDPASHVWNTVVAPLLPDWNEGAVEHLGPLDPTEAKASIKDVEKVGRLYDMGLATTIIRGEYNSIREYKQAFEDNGVLQILGQMDKKNKDALLAEHEKKKKALNGA